MFHDGKHLPLQQLPVGELGHLPINKEGTKLLSTSMEKTENHDFFRPFGGFSDPLIWYTISSWRITHCVLPVIHMA